jgi:2-hydroxychromene-2-carboxylate isomerase
MQFWFDFASMYSYLAAARIGPLAAAAGIDVTWRPFLLGPIFRALGFSDSPFNEQAAKGRYMWRDMARTSAFLGIPFHRPSVFPRRGLAAARVALVGLDEGWGEAFCHAVFAANFVDDRDISDEAVLAELVQKLDGDGEAALARSRTEVVKQALRAATAKAEAAGIFGAPSFVAGGELFWGNDRLEQALTHASAAAVATA